jgi:threonine dehydratase
MDTPTIDDIADADARIRPFAVETPLLEWGALNDRLGGRILCKAEPLQRTGSFKFRGAYNRVSRVDREAFPGGVVACSSGNHAQGVAEAARLCGVDAVIVMPSDAPKVKISRTSQCGAEIVFYDRETEDRTAIARDLCGKLHADFVPPFDDPVVIAGQGSLGLEVTRQAKAAGAEIDAVLVPASGGGLAAGVAIAVKDRFPKAEIWCVEPKGFDDYRRSLAAGARQRNEPSHRSICDALLMMEPGELTFAVNKDLLAGGLAVGDTDVRHAVAHAWREMKLVVEPGGAVALAALLSGAFDANGRTVAIVLSGGNVDPHLFADIICNIKELTS